MQGRSPTRTSFHTGTFRKLDSENHRKTHFSVTRSLFGAWASFGWRRQWKKNPSPCSWSSKAPKPVSGSSHCRVKVLVKSGNRRSGELVIASLKTSNACCSLWTILSLRFFVSSVSGCAILANSSIKRR